MGIETILLGLGGAMAAKSLLGGQKVPDPEAERRKAEAEATKAANADLAKRKKSASASSLLASGGIGDQAATSSALAQGKTKLGQ